MRRHAPYRGENHGPGKELQKEKLHGELDPRPGIREHALDFEAMFRMAMTGV
jgi:hypothetical protein